MQLRRDVEDASQLPRVLVTLVFEYARAPMEELVDKYVRSFITQTTYKIYCVAASEQDVICSVLGCLIKGRGTRCFTRAFKLMDSYVSICKKCEEAFFAPVLFTERGLKAGQPILLVPPNIAEQ